MTDNERSAATGRASAGAGKAGEGVDMPKIVCLCGSTRYGWAFHDANLRETLAGHIVLTIGCDMRSDTEIFADYTPEQLEKVKADLDELHLRKIDLADEVLILNVGGYIGQSTSRELAYAQAHGKDVRYWEPTTQRTATTTATDGDETEG